MKSRDINVAELVRVDQRIRGDSEGRAACVVLPLPWDAIKNVAGDDTLVYISAQPDEARADGFRTVLPATLNQLVENRRIQKFGQAPASGPSKRDHFQSLFPEVVDILQKLNAGQDHSRVYVTGEAVAQTFVTENPQPSDVIFTFCIVGDDDPEAMGLAHSLLEQLREKGLVVDNDYYETSHGRVRGGNVDVFLRPFSTLEQFLAGANVSAAACAFDGERFWATPRGAYSLLLAAVFIDRHDIHEAYEEELSRWVRRGYSLVFPKINRGDPLWLNLADFPLEVRTLGVSTYAAYECLLAEGVVPYAPEGHRVPIGRETVDPQTVTAVSCGKSLGCNDEGDARLAAQKHNRRVLREGGTDFRVYLRTHEVRQLLCPPGGGRLELNAIPRMAFGSMANEEISLLQNCGGAGKTLDIWAPRSAPPPPFTQTPVKLGDAPHLWKAAPPSPSADEMRVLDPARIYQIAPRINLIFYNGPRVRLLGGRKIEVMPRCDHGASVVFRCIREEDGSDYRHSRHIPPGSVGVIELPAA